MAHHLGSSAHSTPSGSQKENNKGTNGQSSTKTPMERGALWTFNETRILLSLWGQDMIQRKQSNSKRTRHAWEKIAERIREHGYDRAEDKVRNKISNLIAEYRRILKNPTPEAKKKCVFFDALVKIYQAKDTNDIKAALQFDEDYNLEPLDCSSQDEGDHDGRGDVADGDNSDEDPEREVFSYAMSPGQAFGHSMASMPPMMNGHHRHSIDDENSGDGPMHVVSSDETPVGSPPSKRLRSDSLVNTMNNHVMNSHAQQQNFANFDNSSSALLIDRMFAHLAKETEVMREWVHLERERLSQEVIRRREEKDREERREKVFLATLTKMQDQMFSYLAKKQEQPTDSDSGLHSPNYGPQGDFNQEDNAAALEDHE